MIEWKMGEWFKHDTIMETMIWEFNETFQFNETYQLEVMGT